MKTVLFLCFFLLGCTIEKPRRTEYLINGQWRFCQSMRSAQCGIYLECGDDTFACVTNLQSRETRK